MTNSNGNSRLDRIEQNLEQLTQTVNQLAGAAQSALMLAQTNREALTQTERMISRNTSAISRLDERMEQFITQAEEDRRRMDLMLQQAEEDRRIMRGIQTENRRILDHLFGENNNQ